MGLLELAERITGARCLRGSNNDYVAEYLRYIVKGDTCRIVPSSSPTQRPTMDLLSNIRKVILEGVFPADCAFLCKDMYNLEEVSIDKSFCSRHITTLSNAFENCKRLEYLDLTGWETEVIEHYVCLSKMFFRCDSLKEVLMGNWNMKSVVDTKSMFFGCSSLKNIDCRNWSFDSLQNASFMFELCTAIESISCDAWNPVNLETAEAMFASCSSLTSAHTQNWPMSKCRSVCFMYENCHQLSHLNCSAWDLSSMEDMKYFVHNCYELRVLNLPNLKSHLMRDKRALIKSCDRLETSTLPLWAREEDCWR